MLSQIRKKLLNICIFVYFGKQNETKHFSGKHKQIRNFENV